ncbi:MAG: hypothetical protein GX556_03640 [Fibrobacter sp.]|nr:hypothetical protein [Fibrobacter sp.]
MFNVLVADCDMDSHELVNDILEINFKNVKIDRALCYDSFLNKLQNPGQQYDLILLNPETGKDTGNDTLATLQNSFPELLDRVILLADTQLDSSVVQSLPVIYKPFSLDNFGEKLRQVCACLL